MSLQSFYPSAIASSSRLTLRAPSSPIQHVRRQSTQTRRTDELRQRPLPDILTTLRSEQQRLTFPPGSIKALALRYDGFGMSRGFREFINVDVPRIKFANPQLLIRPWLLSSIPYPPPASVPREKNREETKSRDNIPRIFDDEPESSKSLRTSSFSDSTKEASVQYEGAPGTSSADASTSTSAEDEEIEDEEDDEEPEVEDNGEILPDPLEIDGGKWRDRFKAAKDKHQLLPSEVIIEYTGRPARTILFSGDDSSTLIDQILDIVHDKDILVESPESPDLLAIEREELLAIKSSEVAEGESPAEGDKQAATA